MIPVIPINIHLGSPNIGVCASNRNPISINGRNYHVCAGTTPEEAVKNLAEFLGAKVDDFEIIYNEVDQFRQSEPVCVRCGNSCDDTNDDGVCEYCLETPRQRTRRIGRELVDAFESGRM